MAKQSVAQKRIKMVRPIKENMKPKFALNLGARLPRLHSRHVISRPKKTRYAATVTMEKVREVAPGSEAGRAGAEKRAWERPRWRAEK